MESKQEPEWVRAQREQRGRQMQFPGTLTGLLLMSLIGTLTMSFGRSLGAAIAGTLVWASVGGAAIFYRRHRKAEITRFQKDVCITLAWTGIAFAVMYGIWAANGGGIWH